jgi:uncharacterized protein (TIGR03382 family)
LIDDEPPGPPGIGAAESVGEKGGCGCSATPSTPRTWPWVLMLSWCMLRKRNRPRSAPSLTP